MEKDTAAVFCSPTYGYLTLPQVRDQIGIFMAEQPSSSYQLIIGTDSQPRNGKGADFVTAIVVHRKGNGGIYFWRRELESKNGEFHGRIYHEAVLSLQTADLLMSVYREKGLPCEIEIHVDIGQNGPTREFLAEVVGMIRGSGFAVRTKPHSFGASHVADRHTTS